MEVYTRPLHELRSQQVNNITSPSTLHGPVLYWMSRDQRVQDNFALLYAQELALKHKQPLLVLFNIDSQFPNFNSRNSSFMINNLEFVDQTLSSLNISMIITNGSIAKNIPSILDEYSISVLITDFSPLKITKKWHQEILEVVSIPFIIVDTHNIIPCWITSSKQEYSARTIRPKIHKLLDDYFAPLPELKIHPYSISSSIDGINWKTILDNLSIDTSVKEITWIKSGENEANKMLQNFIETKLESYNDLKNDPTKEVLSDLSPYIHFGQLSAQRIAWEVTHAKNINRQTKDVFLEELIVRRELADNFCYYNKNYDSFEGFHKWAQQSLTKHLIDKREYIYTIREFEEAKTHDELWNAAQLEMVNKGKMHGYLRMYWAKKILEWTETPFEAQKIAIRLNDKYELDGRDPNGYTGIAWSIGGVHDRPWGPERPIFGIVRYMNYAGAKRKFNVAEFIEQVHNTINKEA